MDNLLKEFEDMGCKVEVGCKEKRRKKTILESIKKLKDSGDDDKINYAKKLYRYYTIINSLGFFLNPQKIPIEEDKYCIHYLCSYLDGIVNTAKMSIAGVIEALGNDVPLDPFCKYLMFTHMYTPEQVKEIGHEEIYRREQKFREDNCNDIIYHQDDGTNGKEYEISGFGWKEDGRGFITVSEKNGNENDIFEEVNIPVPLILNKDWIKKVRDYNNIVN